MPFNRKQAATGFQKLAKEFAGIVPQAAASLAEEVALDYQEAARRAGALLTETYRAGLLAKIPGLAKLIARNMESARLFRQFHGYEVNVGILLSGRSQGARSRDAAITCGLLPQLLPNHPAFRRKAYRGKSPDKQAMLTELQRAAAACLWLADQVEAEGRARATAARDRSDRIAATKALADFANARRKRKTAMAWKDIAAQWLTKHVASTPANGDRLTWRQFYYAWRKHYGDASSKRAARPRAGSRK